MAGYPGAGHMAIRQTAAAQTVKNGPGLAACSNSRFAQKVAFRNLSVPGLSVRLGITLAFFSLRAMP